MLTTPKKLPPALPFVFIVASFAHLGSIVIVVITLRFLFGNCTTLIRPSSGGPDDSGVVICVETPSVPDVSPAASVSSGFVSAAPGVPSGFSTDCGSDVVDMSDGALSILFSPIAGTHSDLSSPGTYLNTL